MVLTSRITEETRVLSRSPRLDEQRVTFFALKIKNGVTGTCFFIKKTRRSPIAHIETLCAVVFAPLFLIRGLFDRKPKTIFLRTPKPVPLPGFDTENTSTFLRNIAVSLFDCPVKRQQYEKRTKNMFPRYVDGFRSPVCIFSPLLTKPFQIKHDKNRILFSGVLIRLFLTLNCLNVFSSASF